ncbi:MAG: DUF488 domain-containing protein [Kiritimatiellae bacterium]|nr:DUF488 domain-containing protein [Kiritimatiellia bacterium]
MKRKRVYDPPEKSDGKRVLVDRLWPRGLSKEKAQVDVWLKEIAPSTELRKWFGHEPEKFAEFNKRFRAELKGNPALEELKALARKETVTIVYSAGDQLHNNAVVLQEILSTSAA